MLQNNFSRGEEAVEETDVVKVAFGSAVGVGGHMAAFGEAVGEAVEIGTGVAGVWRRSQRAAEELERGAEVRGDVEREEDEEGGGEEDVELLALRG